MGSQKKQSLESRIIAYRDENRRELKKLSTRFRNLFGSNQPTSLPDGLRKTFGLIRDVRKEVKEAFLVFTASLETASDPSFYHDLIQSKLQELYENFERNNGFRNSMDSQDYARLKMFMLKLTELVSDAVRKKGIEFSFSTQSHQNFECWEAYFKKYPKKFVKPTGDFQQDLQTYLASKGVDLSVESLDCEKAGSVRASNQNELLQSTLPYAQVFEFIRSLSNYVKSFKGKIEQKERRIIRFKLKLEEFEVELRGVSDDLDELDISTLSSSEDQSEKIKLTEKFKGLLDRIKINQASVDEDERIFQKMKQECQEIIDQLNSAVEQALASEDAQAFLALPNAFSSLDIQSESSSSFQGCIQGSLVAEKPISIPEIGTSFREDFVRLGNDVKKARKFLKILLLIAAPGVVGGGILAYKNMFDDPKKAPDLQQSYDDVTYENALKEAAKPVPGNVLPGRSTAPGLRPIPFGTYLKGVLDNPFLKRALTQEQKDHLSGLKDAEAVDQYLAKIMDEDQERFSRQFVAEVIAYGFPLNFTFFGDRENGKNLYVAGRPDKGTLAAINKDYNGMVSIRITFISKKGDVYGNRETGGFAVDEKTFCEGNAVWNYHVRLLPNPKLFLTGIAKGHNGKKQLEEMSPDMMKENDLCIFERH